MAKIIDSIAKLMRSADYLRSGSLAGKQVGKYFQARWPGQMQRDETGRYVSEEKDVIDEKTFRKIEEEIESNNAELEGDIEEYQERYQEIFGNDHEIEPDIESEVEIFYVMDSYGNVRRKEVEILSCELPYMPEATKFVWRANGDTCDECAELDGTEYETEDDAPEEPHPNCQCELEEVPIDEEGKPDMKNKKTNEEKFREALEKTFGKEGGYNPNTGNPNDQPTNMGIQQGTLDKYNKAYPDKNFPSDVKDLQRPQATQIYRDFYYANTRIPEILDDRIRNAAFDMNVMSGISLATETMQNALNDYFNTGLAVDGVMGPKTIDALNSISQSQISDFMNTLKETRLNDMPGMKNWEGSKNGWTRRVMAY